MPNNPGFGMTKDRFAAFMGKNEKGNFIYKLFESDLADAMTLEYSIPELVESKKKKTKLELTFIKNNAKKTILARNSKYRKAVGDKEDKDKDEIESLTDSINEMKSLLSKEIKKANGKQTDGVINANNLLSETEKKLHDTKLIHAKEMLMLESIFERDIDIIKDIESDDVRDCNRKQKMYVENLADSLKSAVKDINGKYPTKDLEMDPIIEIGTQYGESIINLPLNIIEFVRNKLIVIKPRPVVNSKFGVSEEDLIDNEAKELIRMENEAKIREAQE